MIANTITTNTLSNKFQQQQLINANSLTSISSANKKPLDMNTYVQLEIDSNSSICVARLCKFNINKLILNKTYLESQLNSIIIAIKLHASKRYLRTTEIPLNKTTNGTLTANTNEISINLNLNYNITYPHYLKKSSNYLEFFIQRRKKYKNRPILGYKTLAYASINLENVIQKSYTSSLLLELRQNSITNTSNKLHALTAGSLSIACLTSTSIDLNEIETHHAHEFDDFDLIDVVNNHITNGADKHTKKPSNLTSQQQQQQSSSQQTQPKKLTGKLISFIRKLRNDSLIIDDDRRKKSSSPLIKHTNVDEFDDDDEEEFEQLSDLSDSDCLECDNDLYSIISTPKPTLQPFFSKQISQKSQTRPISFIQSEDSYYLICNSIDSPENMIKESLNWSSLHVININLSKKSAETQFKQELKSIFDTLNERNRVNLILMLNERFFNKFLRAYSTLESFAKLKIMYIPFYYDVNEHGVKIHSNMRTSLAFHLSKYDLNYSPLFCDDFWSNFDSFSIESAKRLKTYVNLCASNIQLPIYSCFINSDDQVPFINHVLLGSLGYSSSSNDEDDDDETILHQSFNGNNNNTDGDNSFNDLSPPQSPACQTNDEDFDLQIDYWTYTLPMSGSLSHSISQKLNKTTIKSSFKSLNVQSTNGKNLSLIYVLKEKKQKKVRLGKKQKDSQIDQKKEVIENIIKIDCSSRHNALFKIIIDGLQHTNVKQFQINTNSNLKLLNLTTCNNNEEQ